jgi:D-alanyl-D-alanine carboxypeptidase (penicillin-binding protein 5/6)
MRSVVVRKTAASIHRCTRCAFTVILVALVLFVASGQAAAERLDSDLVGGVRLADRPEEVATAAPDVAMEAGILIADNGLELWAREPDTERPMASTTKIMTCLLVLEETDLTEEVVVSSRAAAVGGSGVYLRGGEALTVEELTLALMLESSNAAAAALGEHIHGSVDRFVERMNARAGELGLEATSFRNPHGLDAEGHHTSARDLGSLTRTAMGVEGFADTVGTVEATIPGPYGERILENSNELLESYEGATGVKTGWTTPAGYCLVASAERDDVELVAVVLGARDEQTRFTEARCLLDWGFAEYGPRRLASRQETIASVRVTNYLDRKVLAVVEEDLAANVFDLAGDITREWEVSAGIEAPVGEGAELGSLTVRQGERVLGSVPLVAAERVPEPDLWEKVRLFVRTLWSSWFGSSD